MYLALRRSIDFRTRVREKFGRAITSADATIIARAVELRFARLGGRYSWRNLVVKGLIDWVHWNIEHAELTNLLRELAPHGPRIGYQSLAAGNIMAALGLFEAALTYEERGIEFLHRGYFRGLSLPYRVQEIQSSIHRGDRDRAIDSVGSFRTRYEKPGKLSFSVLDLLNYVDVWAGRVHNQTAEEMILKDPAWSRYISGKQVVLYGPGNICPATPRITRSEVVARIAGPGSYSWPAEGDLAGGRADVVYLIPETLNSIGKTPQERINRVGHFDYLCIKRGEAPYLRNSRRVEAGARLFPRGHPNMTPLATIDLLRTPATSVRIIGSDFFASSSSYRADSIRTTPDGRPQTQQGSSGNLYDRCTLMASHNAFQNRRLIKNLLESGRITGDKAFLEACSLSDLDYARRLDLHYGQHRI